MSGLDRLEDVGALLLRLLDQVLGHDAVEELDALLLVLQQAQDELVDFRNRLPSDDLSP